MSEIQEMLGELRRLQGVLGAAVLTTEGMCAASDLDAQFDEAAVAGLVSFLMSTTNRSLAEMFDGKCTRMSMFTTHGKVVVAACEASNLVVITDQFTSLNTISQDIDDAVRRLRRVSRISI